MPDHFRFFLDLIPGIWRCCRPFELAVWNERAKAWKRCRSQLLSSDRKESQLLACQPKTGDPFDAMQLFTGPKATAIVSKNEQTARRKSIHKEAIRRPSAYLRRQHERCMLHFDGRHLEYQARHVALKGAKYAQVLRKANSSNTDACKRAQLHFKVCC